MVYLLRYSALSLSNGPSDTDPWTGRTCLLLLVTLLEGRPRLSCFSVCPLAAAGSMVVSAFAVLLAVAVSAFLLRNDQAQVQAGVVRQLRWAARSFSAGSDDPRRQAPRIMTSGALAALRAVARAPAAPFTTVSTPSIQAKAATGLEHSQRKPGVIAAADLAVKALYFPLTRPLPTPQLDFSKNIVCM